MIHSFPSALMLAATFFAPFAAAFALMQARDFRGLVVIFSIVTGLFAAFWMLKGTNAFYEEYRSPVDEKEAGIALVLWALLTILFVTCASGCSAGSILRNRDHSMFASVAIILFTLGLSAMVLLTTLRFSLFKE